MMMKKWVLILWMCSAAVGTIYADNNLSKALTAVKAPAQSAAFTLARTEWVHFKPAQDGRLTVQSNDGARYECLVRDGDGFLELPAGRYTVHGDFGDSLRIRQVAATLFFSLAGVDFDAPESDSVQVTTHERQSGRIGMYLYKYNYLRKNILGPFNLITAGHDASAMKAWRAEGRKTVAGVHLNAPEKRLETWRKASAPDSIDGVLPDEFIVPVADPNQTGTEFGYLKPGVGFEPRTFADIATWAKESSGKRFYAWLGVPWNAHTRDAKPLLDALAATDGMIVWESYGYPKNWPAELDERYRARAAGYLAARPDAMRYIMVAPATFEQTSNNPSMDFKVWLDKQLQLVATEPQFANLRGLSMWAAYYTDPEILRWFSALIRHYGIEGATEPLAKRYGYKLRPGILENADWSDGLNAWQVTAAAPGSVTVAGPAAWGFKRGYNPRTDMQLKLVRVPGKTNIVSQALQNLHPGQTYVLRAMATAPGLTDYAKYAVNFDLSHAEIVSVLERTMRDFTPRVNQQCYDTWTIVFRPTGQGPCVLSVTDAERPGAVAPAVLLVDGIQITPYFE